MLGEQLAQLKKASRLDPLGIGERVPNARRGAEVL
jgi:hypothetical protein